LISHLIVAKYSFDFIEAYIIYTHCMISPNLYVALILWPAKRVSHK